MNQQTQLETHRVLSVVEEMLDDITVLESLPSSLREFDNGDVEDFGTDFEAMLGEHFDLERKIDMGHSVGNDELLFHHKNSVREICDILKAMPVSRHQSRNKQIANFNMVIATLKELIRDKLNTTVEEDMQKLEILQDTVTREQTASADVKALNKEFKSEQNLRKVEVARRDQAIAKLTEELRMIDENAQDDSKEFERTAREHQQVALQSYQKEEEELLQTVKQLEANLVRTQEENAKRESNLRQERKRKEQFLESLLTQYDGDMSGKTDELDTLQKDFKDDQKRLEVLEKDLHSFDEESSRRAYEDKVDTERRLHHMDILVRMEANARLVQAHWRGFAVRAMLKKKVGKKKKRSKSKSR